MRHELERRRQEALLRSLESPHPEAQELAELGFLAWASDLPRDEVSELVDPGGGTEVRWLAEEGWREADS